MEARVPDMLIMAVIVKVLQAAAVIMVALAEKHEPTILIILVQLLDQVPAAALVK
jgi:hypothetical protein